MKMNKEIIGVPAAIYIEHTCDFADQIMQDIEYRLG
jgi:hypothetical protein